MTARTSKGTGVKPGASKGLPPKGNEPVTKGPPPPNVHPKPQGWPGSSVRPRAVSATKPSK